MMFKKLNLLTIIFILPLLLPQAIMCDSWRVLFYMDASDKLADVAFKNITDMMRGAPNDQITFLVQLHVLGDSALRYQVTSQSLVFQEEITLTGDASADLIAAASWAFSEQNADHTMLILSDHGWGILDPRWNSLTEQWVVESDNVEQSCPIKRGYMFNAATHTYLNNAALIEALDAITSTIIKNKIDILAFDTCMGAMLEVAYQIAPYAHYMLGCQSCALVDGFDYQGIMRVLNNVNNDPLTVAQGMVAAFDSYYREHDDAGIYTHAASDLTAVNAVVDALNSMVNQFIQLPDLLQLAAQVRSASPRFCMWPIYTDTVEFCQLLKQELLQQPETQQISDLIQSIDAFVTAHHKMIVAHCGGQKTEAVAHGSAIYCPFNHIDSSYQHTLFAQQCRWFDLLQMICTDTSSDAEWSVM